MNRERVVSIIVAFACVAAMGVASTTLESSLSSTPDDAIKLDYDTLPIGKDDASEVKKDVQNNEENGQSQSAPERQQQQSSAAAEQQKQQSLLDMLIALLEQLLPYVVGGLLLLAAAVLAYRHRRRLVAPLLALVPSRSGGGGHDDETAIEWRPRNDVEQAWLDLLHAAGVDRPQSKTPAECADDAVASGYDPEPVHSLRRAFEEVRYGEATLTDDHHERVAQSRRRLGLGGER